ncbi:unnamed protein product [Brachionus calyciflorus]|uniref:CxC5 like cysteine cluster associated with KDZ domain-containing protein n=1 Tax=Brachionus calyciflorus TaxID=104777 RepID=A0A814HWG8_9BILA|nr:unnamed protein product [Brachionus calyciflorus]
MIENFIFPFNQIDDLFIFYRIRDSISSKCLNDQVDLLNSFVQKSYKFDDILHFLNNSEHLKDFLPNNFFKKLKSLDEFICKAKDLNFTPDIVLCIKCKEPVRPISKKTEAVVYSLNEGSRNCFLQDKKCIKCNYRYSLSFYYTSDNKRFFYPNVLKEKFISFSNETIVEIKLLFKLTCDIIFNHSSFKSFTNSFNYFHNYDRALINKRQNLEEKRLTETWFYYRFILGKYDFLLEEKIEAFYVNKLDENLQRFNNSIQKSFIKKWSSKDHLNNCKHNDCSFSISIDGNHKINRLKCMYDNVSIKQNEFGDFKIGCLNSPLRNSYYCKSHSSVDEKMTFNYEDKQFKCNVSQIKCRQPGRLEGKNLKIHDSFIDHNENLFYLVNYDYEDPFWAGEKQIPHSVIDNFLSNLKRDIIDSCNSMKKFTLPCEKKNRTVGVFLATFNCGIVCGFKEILKKETLIQTLNFCLELTENLEKCPRYFTYDDACHLKKLLNNGERIKNSSERLDKLKNINLLVDRFHFKTHKKTDLYCKNNCDPDLYQEMANINTSVAEQVNFWYSGFKHNVKHMSRERFRFFIFTISDEKNKIIINPNIRIEI